MSKLLTWMGRRYGHGLIPEAWHTHPLGQALLIAAGCGLVQRECGPVEEVHPGDVV